MRAPLLIATFIGFAAGSCPHVTLYDAWANGRNGNVNFESPATLSGWIITLTFDKPVNIIQPHQGTNGVCSGTTCSFENQNYNAMLYEGQSIYLGFGLSFDTTNDPPEIVSATIADHTTPDVTLDLCSDDTEGEPTNDDATNDDATNDDTTNDDTTNDDTTNDDTTNDDILATTNDETTNDDDTTNDDTTNDDTTNDDTTNDDTTNDDTNSDDTTNDDTTNDDTTNDDTTDDDTSDGSNDDSGLAGKCFEFQNEWNNGYTGDLLLKSKTDITSWNVEVTFSEPFSSFDVWNGNNKQCSGLTCTFSDKTWNGPIAGGQTRKLGFMVNFQQTKPVVVSLKVNGVEICGSNPDDGNDDDNDDSR